MKSVDCPDLMSNPKFKSFVEAFNSLCRSSMSLSMPEARKLSRDFFLTSNTIYEPVGQIQNKVIRGFDNNEIPLRVFVPTGEGPYPVMVFFHRGGWVFGSIEEADPVCRKIANRFKAIVIAVEYRLAPENKFPKALEDCYAATEWAFKNAESFSGIPASLTVAGESAGGNLAAAVALMARDRGKIKLAQQLLIYPILTSVLDKNSYSQCPDEYFLTYDAMKMFWDLYLESEEDRLNPYASPLNVVDLRFLPSTYIVTAEFDPLKVEADKYAQRLKEASVEVRTECFEGVIHGFLDLPIYEEQVKTQAIERIAKELYAAAKSQ